MPRRYRPENPRFREKIGESFARQTFMRTLGATLGAVEPGYCEVRLPFRGDLCQQAGFLHAGVTTTLADNACGFAALSLMPEDSEVLSIEFKANLLRPAVGEEFIARAEVMKPGKTVTVVSAGVVAVTGGVEKAVAHMVATMIRTEAPPSVEDSIEDPAGQGIVTPR